MKDPSDIHYRVRPQVDMRSSRLMKNASVASVAVAGLLSVVKVAAFILTGSIAILSTLVDSLLDTLASFINMIAVRHAVTPADEEHRFGHGKAEAVAGLLQAAIIAGSALFLVVEAIDRLLNPQPVEKTLIGIGVMVFAILMTFGLVLYQRFVIRQTKSVAISADSLHFEGDLLVNVSVIAALVISSYFDFPYADPLFGLAIAAYIGFNAYKIGEQALDMVMDREFPEEDREKIIEIVTAHDAVIDVHDLRTRSSGTTAFIQFHIEVPTDLSLIQAHDISDEVEAAVAKAFPEAEILIHTDPYGIPEKRVEFDE